MLDLILDDGVLESSAPMSRPSVETSRPRVIGYSPGCRSATSSPGQSWSGKSNPATQRTVSRASSRACSRRARRPAPVRWQAVEAADAKVDGVDGPAADELDELVADFLEIEAPLNDRPVVGRQLDGAVVAEEIGRMEQVDVQRVALDPLAAVDEATEVSERAVHGDPAERLDGVGGAHLVGDGADATDSSGDVQGFGERARPRNIASKKRGGS